MSSSGIPVSTRPCLACAAHLGKHFTQVPLQLESVCVASDQAQDPGVTVNMVLEWSWAPNTDPTDPVGDLGPAQLPWGEYGRTETGPKRAAKDKPGLIHGLCTFSRGLVQGV